MNETKQLLERIEAEARLASADMRWVRTCRPGDEIRQGDVYLYPLAGEPEHGPALEHLQLAPGDTPGSRHVVTGHAVLLHRFSADPLDGPLLHAHQRCTVTHPEHAHVSIPAGWYEVRYQRDFSSAPNAERVRPVVD